MSSEIPLRFAIEWLDAEKSAGEEYGPELIGLPTSQWRSAMDRDVNLRRFGTLAFVLDVIHDDIAEAPSRARERAEVVVHYAERVAVPFEQNRVGLAGRAWREYASALTWIGQYPKALEAAQHSQAIFILSPFGSFASEAAKSLLAEALAYRELGEIDRVLELARRCAGVFREHNDAEAYVKARMTEALALLDAKRFRECMEIFEQTAADAEARGDRHTLAICLHNTALAARELGYRAKAKELDARALKHFDQLKVSARRPNIRFQYAMTLADDGHIDAAISELYLAQADLISLGMIAKAAAFGLHIVGLRHARGDDVSAMCSQLVDQFAGLGLLHRAIEAMAYLREQAQRGTISAKQITRVREFVVEVAAAPSLLFLSMPLDDREEEGGA